MDTEEVTADELQHDPIEESDSVASENNESLQPETDESQGSEITEENNDAVSEEAVEVDSSSEVNIDDLSTVEAVDELLEKFETEENFELNSKPEPDPVEDEEPQEEESEEPTTESLDQEQDEQPETEESQEEEIESKPVKRRFAAQNELENEFVSVKQRNPDVSIEDALSMAKKNLGIEEVTEAKAESDEPEESAEPTMTSEEAQLEADAKAEEHRQAMVDLDFEKAAELAVEIRNLDKQVFELKSNEQKASIEAEKQFNANFDADQEKAVAMYPDAGSPNSKLAERMREIDQSLKDTGNDLYFSADKVSKIAQMAANEMGIAPLAPGQKPKAAVKEKSSPKPPKKVPIPPPSASGSAKTNQISEADRQHADSEAISALDSVDALESYLDDAIGGTY
tara:strand:- start:120 stop:1313 length:1194 start_codon:yes stop_codon:yes gene_type:complete